MKEVDYLVVGLGVAGVSFCEQLERGNKSYVVFDAYNSPATEVSGGVFNPVVLKRFTPVWNAQEFCANAVKFYHSLSAKLQVELITDLPVWRIFYNVEEQNDWMVASDRLELSNFLSSEILKNLNANIKAPYGFGKVLGSGKIFPKQLLTSYREYLQNSAKLVSEAFDYSQLSEVNGKIRYQNYSATRILFCEGAKVIANPFFKNELLIGNKGEYIVISAPNLKLGVLLKGSMFVIPLGNDLYKVGATFAREDYSTHATDKARDEIVLKLQKMIQCDFEVVDQIAGVRPTTKDRKPLLGVFTDHPNMVFFNGLGTRGLMMAPTLAGWLYNSLERNTPLPKEVDINRFN